MRFLHLSILLSFSTITTYAQEEMGSIWEIKACENIPREMLPVQKWLEQTVKPLYVSSLQSSNSYWGDNNSISFAFTGKSSLNIPLANTNGVKLRFDDAYPPEFRSQKLRLVYTEQIMAYRIKPGYESMPKTDEAYFNTAYDLLKIAPSALLAHVFNFEIEDKEGTTKMKTFTDRVNAKMKSNLTLPEKDPDNFSQFNRIYEDYFKENKIHVIYKTFIEQKDSKATMEKMNRFFQITRFFPNGIKAKVDDFFTPQFKLGMDKTASILFPAMLISTPGEQGIPADFKFRNVQGKLDYLSKSLILSFDGRFEKSFILNTAKIYDYSAEGAKAVFLKDKYNTNSNGHGNEDPKGEISVKETKFFTVCYRCTIVRRHLIVLGFR